MTGLQRIFDAAYPPEQAPPGCAGVLGYIGGKRALNTWTLTEWDRFPSLAQFPAYVPDLTVETPVDAAVMAATLARELGWAPFQADRRVIVCDLETAVVPGWYQRFAAELEQQGFTAVAYGSLSTVSANFAADVWIAVWDGAANLLPGQTIHAHQYQSSGGVDLSVADQWLFDRAGIGPRHR